SLRVDPLQHHFWLWRGGRDPRQRRLPPSRRLPQLSFRSGDNRSTHGHNSAGKTSPKTASLSRPHLPELARSNIPNRFAFRPLVTAEYPHGAWRHPRTTRLPCANYPFGLNSGMVVSPCAEIPRRASTCQTVSQRIFTSSHNVRFSAYQTS